MEIKVLSALTMLGGGLAYLHDNEVSMDWTKVKHESETFIPN